MVSAPNKFFLAVPTVHLILFILSPNVPFQANEPWCPVGDSMLA
jgi:hypothetical protein